LRFVRAAETWGVYVDDGITTVTSTERQAARYAKSLDYLERAGWTAGQQFFAVLLATGATGTAVDLPWKLAASMAAGAAIISLVTTAVQYSAKQTGGAFWKDLAWRLSKTFLASLGASFGADKAFDVLAFDWSSALDLAVLTTLGALGKGLLARAPDSGDNPSTLLPGTYELAVQR
jgi:hypothetical protein